MKIHLLAFIFSFISISVYSQTNIISSGTDSLIFQNNGTKSAVISPDGSLRIGSTGAITSSSLLQMNSTTKGLLTPRMTSAQRDAITTPATGLLIYNTTTNEFNFYNGTIWSQFFPSTSNVWSGDGTSVYLNDNSDLVGIGTNTPHAQLQLGNTLSNRKIVLYEVANNDHEVASFGINAGTLRYQIPATSNEHSFYAGTSSATSVQLFRIMGNGRIKVPGTSILDMDNGISNRRIILYEAANNDHEYNGLGINSGVFRYQSASTTNDHVFYAATSSTTSSELMRIKGTGNVGIGTSSPNYILQVNDPSNTQGSIQITAGTTTGTSNTDGFIISNNGSGVNLLNRENTPIYFGTNGTNKMVLDLAGNLGLGNTSPSSLFAVGSTSQFQVDANGNIVKLNNVNTNFPASNAAGFLYNSGTGNLSWSTAGILAGGTSDYLARWTGTNTLSIGTIQDNGTYIGIGTTPNSGYKTIIAESGTATGLFVNQTGTGSGQFNYISNNTNTNYAFQARNDGLGVAGEFQIVNATNNSNAINVNTNGGGSAINAYTSGTGNTIYAGSAGSGNVIYSSTTGTGGVGYFINNNASNNSNVISAYTNGSGTSVAAGNTGTGSAISAYTNGTGNATFVQVDNATTGGYGLYLMNNGPNSGIYSSQTGTGPAGTFLTSSNSNFNPSLSVSSNGTGPAISASNSHTGIGIEVYNNNASTALYTSNSGSGFALDANASGSKTSNYTAARIYNNATGNTASAVKVALNINSLGAWSGAAAINKGLEVSVSGGTTNYAATFNGGNVGIGNGTPSSLLSVGASEQFQVNSSGNIIKLNNVNISFPAANATGVLSNDGAGNLAWSTNTSIAPIQSANNGLSVTANAVGLGGTLTLPTTIAGTGATGTLTINNNSITNNSALIVSSNSTLGSGSTSSNTLYLTRSGVNTNAAHTAYGINVSVTNTNATSGTNVAAYLSASGATSGNYALIVPNTGGNVGIGTTTPATTLDVFGLSNIAANSVNTSTPALKVRNVQGGSSPGLPTGTSALFAHAASDGTEQKYGADISATTSTGTGGVTGISILASGNTSSSTRGIDVAASGGTASSFGVRATQTSTTATNAYGLYASVTGATAGTNIAGYFGASGATTGNYALIVPSGGGSVGIGTSTPVYNTEIHNGAGDGYLAVSTQGNGASDEAAIFMHTQNNAAGSLLMGAAGTKGWDIGARGNSWGVAGEQNDFYISRWDGSTWNQMFNIDMVSGAVGIGVTAPSSSSKLHIAGSGNGSTTFIEDNSITNGSALYISSTATTGTASNSSKMINIQRSGANANTAHTAYGISASVTNTNATSGTNIAGYFNASGATTGNYALVTGSGKVGFGTSSPVSNVQISGGGDLGLHDGSTPTNNGAITVWMYNGSGADIESWVAVVPGTSNNSIALAGNAATNVIGVTYETIVNGTYGRVAVAGIALVKQNVAILAADRGKHVIASASNNGRAAVSAAPATNQSFGIVLEAPISAGAAGRVKLR